MRHESRPFRSVAATVAFTLSLAFYPALTMAISTKSPNLPELTISRDGQALRVDIQYTQPVDEHGLGPGLAPIQGDGWKLLEGDPPVRLERGRIVADRDWRQTSLQVSADPRRLDRVYGANLPLGSCGQLVRPGAFTDLEEVSVTFRGGGGDVIVSPLRSQTAATRPGEPPLRFLANEMTYFGRAECVHPGAGATWIYDPAQVPPTLLAIAERSLGHALRSLPLRLAAESARQPVVALRYLSGTGRVSWHGDVDARSMIVLEVSGPEDTIGEDLVKQLETFIVHEVFHLWNGATFRQYADRSRAWLSEGMAEYAALKLLREDGRIDDRMYFANLSTRMNGCLAGTGIRPGGGNVGIDALDTNGGRLVYDCGTVIQWIADNALPEDSDLFKVWSGMFAATGDSKEYDAAGFLRQLRAHTGDTRVAMIEWLVDGGYAKSTPELLAALDSLGIGATDASDDGDNPTAVQTALMHLLEQHCSGGSYGFVTEPDHLVLDTANRCGPLNGDPVISTIEGYRIGSQNPQIHAAVGDACARSGIVVLAHGKEALTVGCSQLLSPLPARLRILRDRFPSESE